MTSLDQIPLLLVLIGAILGQVLFIEAGYRIGSGRKGKQSKAQMAQVRAIMGASLGLLAFMLAFTFNSAQQHFEQARTIYPHDARPQEALKEITEHLHNLAKNSTIH
mgnify:CR=1 FL=1